MTYFINIAAVTSFGDVQSAVETACVSNGWALNSGWLEKGEVSIRLSVQSGSSPSYTQLKLEARTPALEMCPRVCYMRVSDFSGLSANLDIHISDTPDTVWVSLNVLGDVYGHMGFGFLSKYTMWKGGTWIFGSQGSSPYHIIDRVTSNIAFYNGGSQQTPSITSLIGYRNSATGSFNCMPFWENADYANNFGALEAINNFIHCELRGRIWEYDAYNDSYGVGSLPYNYIICPQLMKPLFAYPANTFNSQTILLPFSLGLFDSTGRIVPIGFPEHIRYVNMQNITSGQIVAVGSQNWKVYPACKRDSAYPRGASLIGSPTTYYGSTGLLGIAVRTT